MAVHAPLVPYRHPWYGHTISSPSTVPSESAVPRWMQRSENAWAVPDESRQRTSGSARRSVGTGRSPSSVRVRDRVPAGAQRRVVAPCGRRRRGRAHACRTSTSTSFPYARQWPSPLQPKERVDHAGGRKERRRWRNDSPHPAQNRVRRTEPSRTLRSLRRRTAELEAAELHAAEVRAALKTGSGRLEPVLEGAQRAGVAERVTLRRERARGAGRAWCGRDRPRSSSPRRSSAGAARRCGGRSSDRRGLPSLVARADAGQELAHAQRPAGIRRQAAESRCPRASAIRRAARATPRRRRSAAPSRARSAPATQSISGTASARSSQPGGVGCSRSR